MSEFKADALSVVTLGVSDLQRARRYYASLFDAGDEPAGDGPCYLRLRGTWLALYPRDALAAYFNVPPAGSGFSGVTLSVNVADPGQVDASCARLRAAGGRVTLEPGPAAWGGRIACVADADGHLLELVWNPKFKAGEAPIRPLPARIPRPGGGRR